ncbi:hypothetical protein GCM10022219_15830 [Microbacterium oryzae]|uniref:hypothetical protein n=1 Tax=Microbacterium oryzae TaxID=743009 RepID=UPI001FE98F6D|nr:hypothetical protein [Microbacterium oryzae]
MLDIDIELEDVLVWLVPAAIVFAGAALVVVLTVWIVKRARRGRRARAKAGAALDAVGATLVRLDDDLDELELELSLSGALYGGDPPPALRRARMTAQHTRDDAFAAYRDLRESTDLPARIRRRTRALAARLDSALRSLAAARTAHDAWIEANVTASAQIDAARGRLTEVEGLMGDPAILLRELAEHADPEEWTDAADAATAARAALDDAACRLDAAARCAEDPTQSPLDDLAEAERRLRTAEQRSRALEERHRIVLQAAQAVPDELEAAAAAIRSATAMRAALEPADAERLGEEIARAADELDRLRAQAGRRPVATNEAIARLRDRLDMALADARTAQQRLLGARSALPGTLAAARSALARAEAAVGRGSSLDARVRLDAARTQLAQARQTADPVEALDDARRAIRHAEDAKALADYDDLARDRT